jgi:hypothetical protein
MPYITARERIEIADGNDPLTAGQLTYLITVKGLEAGSSRHDILTLLRRYVDEHGKCFQVFAEILGACTAARLECQRRRMEHSHRGQRRMEAAAYRLEWAVRGAAEDFYTHVVGPYEDTKIAENGDLPEFKVV